ncbi:TonB-dependent receptor [Sphingomonas abietis]|uniref:TonB-dependent receptor n=1 Tax=Sphingomonas abietis TaxID=3012344 RepID=A0ABY7NZ42_9SPHN|nr:TonB-dependent receptor [Sphingomonas abietis]WBO24651.1 TonB-dependent receptor [Sphingomonas abietis]
MAWTGVGAMGVASTGGVAMGGATTYNIAAGPLRTALVNIGETAGITIGLADSALGEIRVHAVHGRMSTAAALSHMLAGTPAWFRQIDAQTFLVVRRSPPAPLRHAVRATIPPPIPEIVVTGSKRSAALSNYPGSVAMLDPSDLSRAEAARGSDTLVALLPILSSTHLGPGRNKLFIRGIADSSFNGPTEATVGQYLGDVRLNYSAPDPDLALYDIGSVEVLEGPQGTLYGAGSLGGVIRLQPTPPDLTHWAGSLSAGIANTAHGTASGDGAIILNVPLIDDRLALRMVGYGSLDGGYIDDPSRGKSAINRTITRGGRMTLRFAPAPDWTIDLGGVRQDIDSRDGQYATRGLPALQRASVIAQPFDNDYSLASLEIHHQMGTVSLISATSVVDHDVGSTYDASPAIATPTRYHEQHDIMLVTNETRLSHRAATGGGWTIGIELLRSADRLRRTLGPAGAEASLAGTSNTVEEASLYGEATLALGSRWFATAGGRLSVTRQVGDVLDLASGDDDHDRHALAALPSIGLTWKAAPRLAFYARYQEGFRPGGIAVQAGAVQHFEGDSVATWEAGLRYGAAGDRFSAVAALSYAHWEDIQADLVDAQGLPYTANIGSGRIAGIELKSSWRPTDTLTVDGALFANESDLSKPDPAFAGEKDASLPNIADLTLRLGFTYHMQFAGRPISLTGSADYVGHSRLGVGPLLDLHQGGYVETRLGMSVPVGRVTLSLAANNLLNARGNIFALGDPFGVTNADQITPMRPRTVRLGATVPF